MILRYNPNGQEAVVPLETRGAHAYILAFDNTNETATGVAINGVSAQAVSIPVVIRDETGMQIATDTISLAANGHLAFTLVTDKYPVTANIRGSIEFDKPAGAQIGILGIRIHAIHHFILTLRAREVDPPFRVSRPPGEVRSFTNMQPAHSGIFPRCHS